MVAQGPPELWGLYRGGYRLQYEAINETEIVELENPVNGWRRH